MTEADFIRAVIAHPDDDAPRLIMADWLDEQGQCERAEFIRLQIFGARGAFAGCQHGAEVTCRRCEGVRRRETELLRSNRLRWWPAEWATIFRVRRRGFVESVVCTAEEWLKHGDAILACQPIREVTLTTKLDGGDRPADEHFRRRWPSVKTWNTPA